MEAKLVKIRVDSWLKSFFFVFFVNFVVEYQLYAEGTSAVKDSEIQTKLCKTNPIIRDISPKTEVAKKMNPIQTQF